MTEDQRSFAGFARGRIFNEPVMISFPLSPTSALAAVDGAAPTGLHGAGGIADGWHEGCWQPHEPRFNEASQAIARSRHMESGKNEKGGIGYIVAWLLGVPIPILILVALLRSCG